VKAIKEIGIAFWFFLTLFIFYCSMIFLGHRTFLLGLVTSAAFFICMNKMDSYFKDKDAKKLMRYIDHLSEENKNLKAWLGRESKYEDS